MTKKAEWPMRSEPKSRLVLVAAVLILAAGFAAIFGPAASARAENSNGTGEPFSTVTGVDASGSMVEVAIISDDYSVSSSDVALSENGQPVENVSVATSGQLARSSEVIYVIDLDNRTMVDGGLSSMAAAVFDSIQSLPSTVRVGLVSAGEQANLRTRLTADRDRIKADLQALTPGRGAALYDAVSMAAQAFSDTNGGARSIVVLSSGPDTASATAIATVDSALVQSGAQLISVAQGSLDTGLSSMVTKTGGTAILPATVADAGLAIEDATTIAADRLIVSYPGRAEAGQRAEVVLDIAGRSLSFSYPAGVNTITGLQLAAGEMEMASEPGFFSQPVVLYVSLGLAFLAISTALWALGSMFAGGETSLDKVLARYSEGDETLNDEEVQEMLVQTALVRRAIDMTESFAERRGFLTRMEELLERANLPVRAGEALFFLSAIVVVGFGLIVAMTGSLILAGIVAIIGTVGGFATVQFIATRRLKHFEAQLPDALQLLAGTMRAGYSLPQGLDAVSTEISDPMGQELRRAITETQLGRELEEALAGIAERLDSEDFAWAVMAIGIQREVGGNLSEVLMTVSETMIQRERLHREVAALTAEGRVSAGILSMLPPGLGFVMWVMNPAYLSVLFDRTIGLILLGLAVVAGLIGLAWMKKVITIDV